MTNVLDKTRENILSAYAISKNKIAETRIFELNAFASMVLARTEKTLQSVANSCNQLQK